MSREVVIVDSVRTALAKSHRGSFNLTHPVELMAHCTRSLLGRVPQLDPAEISDVFTGCSVGEGPQGYNVSRNAALAAGLPVDVAACTINRFCSSGSQAIASAAHLIQCEGSDVVLAGGVEAITHVETEHKNLYMRESELAKQHQAHLYMPMGQTAELVAQRYGISREDQDRYALLSQQRMAAAQQNGLLKDEIVPMHVTRRVIKKGEEPRDEQATADRDECNRPQTTLESLAKLEPVFTPREEGGSVTAGNACQLSDGASATLVMSAERARALGIQPMGLYRGSAVAGCAPEEMGIGPVRAVPKLLTRLGLTLDDIDVVELNEAFASQVVYCQRELGIPEEKLNPNGGSIAIGHPYGMTGSRMTGHLLRELQRRGGRYGIVTMCVGGGQGWASLFEAC
jgi:acetyl-CoA acyltransferase